MNEIKGIIIKAEVRKVLMFLAETPSSNLYNQVFDDIGIGICGLLLSDYISQLSTAGFLNRLMPHEFEKVSAYIQEHLSIDVDCIALLTACYRGYGDRFVSFLSIYRTTTPAVRDAMDIHIIEIYERLEKS